MTTSRVYRNEEVLWREEEDALAEAEEKLAGDGDVADLGTSILFAGGEIVALNLLGTEIWKRCDGRTVEEIVAGLLEQFEVEADVLRTDVEAFLADLAGRGWVRHAR
ncbi:MAG: GeoRSP system PqqD family peptide chaperone [Deltaproteobacteria bacterium]|nr:GeoRSP system PqqD family peptide chaperone [Deltaproteobacteria bacterium]